MIETAKEFPYSRLMHCHNVGLKMMEYAQNVLGHEEEYCHEMYILGLLHDIGLLFEDNSFDHAKKMSKYLMFSNYRYGKEIKYSSHYQQEYDTPALRLLYFGDSTVDAYGNWVTYEERLEDLKRRHGENSSVYLTAQKKINKVKLWGFDDNLDRIDPIKLANNVFKDYCSICKNCTSNGICTITNREEESDFFCNNFAVYYTK